MSSKEVTDIYSTEEPQSAFHARVAFCLDIHNEVSFVNATLSCREPRKHVNSGLVVAVAGVVLVLVSVGVMQPF